MILLRLALTLAATATSLGSHLRGTAPTASATLTILPGGIDQTCASAANTCRICIEGGGSLLS